MQFFIVMLGAIVDVAAQINVLSESEKTSRFFIHKLMDMDWILFKCLKDKTSYIEPVDIIYNSKSSFVAVASSIAYIIL